MQKKVSVIPARQYAKRALGNLIHNAIVRGPVMLYDSDLKR